MPAIQFGWVIQKKHKTLKTKNFKDIKGGVKKEMRTHQWLRKRVAGGHMSANK